MRIGVFGVSGEFAGEAENEKGLEGSLGGVLKDADDGEAFRVRSGMVLGRADKYGEAEKGVESSPSER